ncbi:MAG: molecular chaperone TorD family protein [Chloroflexi bacterium]|nr:molecular chaperone TorD family protein [Chloroflexota bacterium]
MDSYVSDASLYPLLSCLWLHEPDSTALAEARRHEPFANALETDSDQTALASAYADLFLLNVYPYGTAYTDEWGELNTGTPSARPTTSALVSASSRTSP